MKVNSKRTMILLTVLGIASLLVAIIGATFAFFTANIKYVNEPEDVVTKSEVLEIIYKTKNEILYKNLYPGRPGYESQSVKQENNSLKFSVEGNKSMSLRTPYNIYFVITENTFDESKDDSNYSNLVYILNGVPGVSTIEKKDINGNVLNTNSIIVNSCIPETGEQTEKCGTGQIFNETNSILHTFEGDAIPTKLGKVEKLKTGRVKIGSAVLGAFGAKDEWEFDIWVNEIGTEQNEDQGKVIKGYIEIDTEDENLYK